MIQFDQYIFQMGWNHQLVPLDVPWCWHLAGSALAWFQNGTRPHSNLESKIQTILPSQHKFSVFLGHPNICIAQKVPFLIPLSWTCCWRTVFSKWISFQVEFDLTYAVYLHLKSNYKYLISTFYIQFNLTMMSRNKATRTEKKKNTITRQQARHSAGVNIISTRPGGPCDSNRNSLSGVFSCMALCCFSDCLFVLFWVRTNEAVRKDQGFKLVLWEAFFFCNSECLNMVSLYHFYSGFVVRWLFYGDCFYSTCLLSN